MSVRALNELSIVNKMPTHPLSRPPIRLVHTTAGRSRYYFAAILNNPGLSEYIEKKLRQQMELIRIEVRWQSGSVVLEYAMKDAVDLQRMEVSLAEALQDYESGAIALSQTRPSSPTVLDSRAQTDAVLLSSTLSGTKLLKAFQTDETHGLSLKVANERKKLNGLNVLHERVLTDPWRLFGNQFNNSTTGLLSGSALVSLLMGGAFDAAMIAGVVALNGVIGYLTEAHADEVISSIGIIEQQSVRVLRDGRIQIIPDKDLVPGDIIELASGIVPADIRILDAKGIMVDESPLTGESMPVVKSSDASDPSHLESIADFKNLLFRGTVVTSGQGRGLVVGTGENTEIGRVRSLVENTKQLASPLETELETLNRQTVTLSGAVCASIFAIGLLRGRGLLRMLQTSVLLAVAAVPEGLPTIGTTTMAIGVANLKRKNVFPRRLKVLETLGSIEILCLDKTGTVTMNDMIADAGYLGFQRWRRSDLMGEQGDMIRRLAVNCHWGLIAALCNDCELASETMQEGSRWTGSSTEKAIIELAESMEIPVVSVREDLPRFLVAYRTEEHQYMVTYHRLGNTGLNLAAIKGNPEQLLGLCSHILDEGHSLHPIDPRKRRQLELQNDELAREGMRVLGFAYLQGIDLGSIEGRQLVWVGVVGLLDPVREGMPEMVKQFQQAGIRTIMMTGDQTETAEAIGKTLGLNGDAGSFLSMDAKSLRNMNSQELQDQVENVQIFSRVSPSDKLLIVQALQSRGRIVAMAGDGINDSPALKAAHIGIAMGVQGSSAARDSADIVIRDDNLKIIFEALKQGRTVRANLRKSIKYLLATNLSEIVVMFCSIALGHGAPLNATQLLWINLLTDVLPGLALALDFPSEDVMRSPPPDPQEPILSARNKWTLALQASVMASGSLLSYELSRLRDKSEQESNTMAFTSLGISQILHTLSSSADRGGILRNGLTHNPKIYQAVGIGAGTIGLGLASPLFRRFLGNAALSRGDLGVAVLNGILPFVIIEWARFLHVSQSQQHEGMAPDLETSI